MVGQRHAVAGPAPSGTTGSRQAGQTSTFCGGHGWKPGVTSPLGKGGVATVMPTRGVPERNSGEESTNSGPDAAGADMARLTAGLHWNGPAAHVGSPRRLTVDHGAGPPDGHGDGPPGPVFFFFFSTPPGQGGRPGGFVYPGFPTPAAVCLYWARHPAVHDGLFILGPSPQQCNPWRPPRSPKQKQQPRGGGAQTHKKNNKQRRPKREGQAASQHKP